MGQQMAFDSSERLVGVVVCLLDQTQLLTLILIEAILDAESLLQIFQGQNKKFGVMLVRGGREWNRRKLAAFQPMHKGCVDSDGLFS